MSARWTRPQRTSSPSRSPGRIAVLACVLWCFRSPLPALADALALGRLSAGNHGYGRIRPWMSIGWTLAVLLWGVVLDLGSIALLPLTYAVSVALVAGWARLGLGPSPTDKLARAGPRITRSTLRPLLGVLISLALVMGASNATTSFLSLRIDGLGGGLILVGVAAAIQAAAEVPVMMGMRRLSRALRRRLRCHGIAFAAWAMLTDPLWISLIKIVSGVGFALVYVGSVIIVDDLVPPELRASGHFGVAPIAGSAAGGLLYGLAGPRAMFLAALAAVTLGAVAALISAGASPRRTG